MNAGRPPAPFGNGVYGLWSKTLKHYTYFTIKAEVKSKTVINSVCFVDSFLVIHLFRCATQLSNILYTNVVPIFG